MNVTITFANKVESYYTRAAQHCGVVEVEIDGKLVYPF